jgi:polar amino acid transport system substrate-binding protein
MLHSQRVFRRFLRFSGGAMALFAAWGLPVGAAAQGSPVQILSMDAGVVAVADAPPVAAAGAKVRTPGRIEVLLAQSLAGGPDTALLAASDPLDAVQNRGAGIWLGVWPDAVPVPAGIVRRTLDYRVGPTAIMRSDTDIREWRALAGRTVCVVGNGPYAGELAQRFDAIEQGYPSATDVLLAVRAGQCDAGVLNDRLVNALAKFPEWKKFSARLPAYRHAELVWASSQAGAEEQWGARMETITSAKLAAMTAQQARDIAFEVYLDQVVPDCH